MNKLEILKQCTIESNIIKLPSGQLNRKLYQEVAKSLELIGGKWKGKPVFGFVFPSDPTDLLKQIANGENRNLKKEFQFFATPQSLAREMVWYADLDGLNERSHILEPSAGQGAIINAILEKENINYVDYCETMDINQTFLSKIQGANYLFDDFLCVGNAYNNYYDRIIANPPFSKNQDIDHIRKMYDVCRPSGRIVTIASKHWLLSSNKKETEFKNWLYNELEADINTIDAGIFSESGTKIETCLIIIDKK
jgi:predicted RNA methylase